MWNYHMCSVAVSFREELKPPGAREAAAREAAARGGQREHKEDKEDNEHGEHEEHEEDNGNYSGHTGGGPRRFKVVEGVVQT